VDGLRIVASARGLIEVARGRGDDGDDRAGRRMAARTREELTEYLSGLRTFFSVPVDWSRVPDFQRRVLRSAATIPFGEARPYAWIARRIGAPGAVRAVGNALAGNPVPLVVPCHRVVRSDGGSGGYALGAALKTRLLGLEQTTPVLAGCTTTRIVCRVGCPHGLRVRADRRVVFASVADARAVGYRPCAVCRPAA